MKPQALDLIVCPACKSDFDLRPFATEKEEIVHGVLSCQGCGSEFPVHRGVPRLTVSPAYADPDFESLYAEKLESSPTRRVAQHRSQPTEAHGLIGIRRATAASFGYEWEQYGRFGFEARRTTETDEERRAIERCVFLSKALAKPEEFVDRRVLDAGCGNGRYLLQAAELGAEAVGVDISGAVDVAYRNLRHHPSAHVLQADLFQLPFRLGTFDRVFSIGVLMHTGDARRAFFELVPYLRPEGSISIHVYRRGNAVYEFLDAWLRRRTTGMDHARLMRLSKRIECVPKALYATRTLTFGRPLLYQLVNCLVRLEFGHHYIFDWYSAPVASHHTYEEVFGWFADADLDVTDHRDEPKGAIRRLLKSPAGGVTVRGGVKGALPAVVAARNGESAEGPKRGPL